MRESRGSMYHKRTESRTEPYSTKRLKSQGEKKKERAEDRKQQRSAKS